MNKKGKIYRAWAVKNQHGGIEIDSARMPIYWRRASAKLQAEEYYDIRDGNHQLLRVEIKVL